MLETWRDCTALVVDRIDARFGSVEALKARLYGLRIADNCWLSSAGKQGGMYTFRATMYKHMYLYLSAGLQLQHPEHSRTLRKICGRAEKGLRVINGDRPSDARFPRLSFQAVADGESLENKTRRCFSGDPNLNPR